LAYVRKGKKDRGKKEGQKKKKETKMFTIAQRGIGSETKRGGEGPLPNGHPSKTRKGYGSLGERMITAGRAFRAG